MPTRRKRTSASLAVKTAELAFAAPQVVAHRLARMALAGPQLSSRDRTEFTRMVAEKNTAFTESWLAMATQATLANQALAMSFFRSFKPGRKPSAAATAAQLRRAAVKLAGAGLAPVHRKAVANSKRLARTKLR